jgi:hypothetical protein
MATMPKELAEVLSLAKTKEDMEKVLALSFLIARTEDETGMRDGKHHDELEEKTNLLLNRQEEAIEVGDLVTWKRGLKNKKYPQEGQSAKVIEVLSPPLINDKEDSGSPYFGEKLNLVLAILDEDGELLLYHYDKRRFQVVEKAKLPTK